jgi:hypothetical protein
MAEEKRYCRGSGKKYTFEDGGEIINLSVVPSQLAEYLVQVNKERVEQGEKESEFLTIQIAQKRTPGEWGDTHYSYVRPYKKYTKKDSGSTKSSPKKTTRKKKDENGDEMPWD